MKLDIKNFLKSSDSQMSIKGNLSEDHSNYDTSDLGLIFPIDFSGKLYNLGSEVLLDLIIDYKYNTCCDRCLKDLIKEETLDTKIYFSLDNSDYKDDAFIQYFELEDGEIFLDDVILSEIITRKPFKDLCSEDCKGLCPICGANLNENSCSCTDESKVDLRFEKLLGLFSDEEV